MKYEVVVSAYVGGDSGWREVESRELEHREALALFHRLIIDHNEGHMVVLRVGTTGSEWWEAFPAKSVIGIQMRPGVRKESDVLYPHKDRP